MSNLDEFWALWSKEQRAAMRRGASTDTIDELRREEAELQRKANEYVELLEAGLVELPVFIPKTPKQRERRSKRWK